MENPVAFLSFMEKLRTFASDNWAGVHPEVMHALKCANDMAELLSEKLERVPGITHTQKVDSNAVFAQMSLDAIPHIQERFPFHVWNEETSEVRLMTSFETRKKDVEKFVKLVREEVGRVLSM